MAMQFNLSLLPNPMLGTLAGSQKPSPSLAAGWVRDFDFWGMETGLSMGSPLPNNDDVIDTVLY
ncbi:MAG: hypothetical protein HC910_15855 [Spirulinaceae cyanobacterium SM2_1_0]|nr:hypothetical protein [Spirulinaceae cyanobacterium SM2_1_0]